MKRFTCAILASMMLLSVGIAFASSTPTSQFGYGSIWPYRQQSPCHPTEPVFQTATPTQAPVITPAPQQTKKPTLAPTATPTFRPVSTPSASTGDYTTLSVAAQEQKLLNLLNQDRLAHGLPALSPDPELSRIARIKSQDMKENRYFAHTSPTYGNAASMLSSFGYAYQGVGENIAHHATVEKAQAAFMSSSGHRQNILGSQWKKVGIGICIDANGFIYATQLFVR